MCSLVYWNCSGGIDWLLSGWLVLLVALSLVAGPGVAMSWSICINTG